MHKVDAYLSCLPRQEAQKLWWEKLEDCGYFQNLPKEVVAVTQSRGRVTAQSLYARRSVPHYNGSAMDGIAVRSQDTFGAGETAPVKLFVLQAGQSFVAGGCYIVDTGDLLPKDTDAVIMIEDVFLENGFAQILAAATPWQHVRIIGEDIVVNEMVLPEYSAIRPVDIAAILASGVNMVEVVAKPQVTVIPTGSELIDIYEQPVPGAILDVNSHMLSAAVDEWGAIPKRHEIVHDDYQILKQKVAESVAHSDMVIINAGTSAGTEDFTAGVLAELGEVLLHGVAIKPGKPIILAICQGKPVIGLPGYPVSAMLTAELFVKNILFGRQRLPMPEAKMVQAVMTKQMHSNVGVEEYIRVALGNVQGKTVAVGLGRGAGIISSLTKAQGIAVVPQSSTGFSPGTSVKIRLLGDQQVEDTILSIGSHDMALDILGVFLRRHANITLSCSNVGSMGGIMSIHNNEAHIAGIHLLDDKTGEYNIAYLSKYMGNKPWCLVHLAMRQQGLIVAPGNPKGILKLADVTRPDITFINRQRGSGTRMLLDYHLGKLGFTGSQIKGYDKVVATHMAVAATIAGGAVDVGMGIGAAAQALGMDFVPIAQEQYDVILNFPEGDSRAETILGILRSEEFRSQIEALGGYDLKNAGAVLATN